MSISPGIPLRRFKVGLNYVLYPSIRQQQRLLATFVPATALLLSAGLFLARAEAKRA